MKKLLLILSGATMIVLFQNCSPVSYKAMESDLAKATGERDPGIDPVVDSGDRDPGADPAGEVPPTREPGNDPKDPVKPPRDPGVDTGMPPIVRDPGSEVPVTVGNPKSDCDYCKLLDDDRVITAGTQDFNYSGHKGHISIASGKDVTIAANNGSLRIENAASLSVMSQRGSIQAKALEVGSIDGVTGSVCIVADSIGKINNIKGDLKISAKEVDEISVVNGKIKIFGGVVKSIVTAKSVCLYEGAQVLNVGAGVSVKKCD